MTKAPPSGGAFVVALDQAAYVVAAGASADAVSVIQTASMRIRPEASATGIQRMARPLAICDSIVGHLSFTLCSPRLTDDSCRERQFGQFEPMICPNSGRNLRICPECPSLVNVWRDRELVSHVAATTGLSEAEASRVVEDVVAFLSETVEDYVRRRHTELRTYGAKNSQIFEQVAAELAQRVVAAPELTERQLRRIVYG